VTSVEEAGRGTVYNIAVATDESYIADGAIVHNCQPASTSGRREGAADHRWLWGETLRVIAEVRPRWVVLENPTGLTSLVQPAVRSELESDTVARVEEDYHITRILESLEEAGYAVQVFVLPACAVGAPHRRDRVWIVGNTQRGRWEGNDGGRAESVLEDRPETAADTSSAEQQRYHTGELCQPAWGRAGVGREDIRQAD